MIEITVLSGKGGTGKTSVTSALGYLAENAVLCDNDVDAADLFIILDPEVKEEHRFESGHFVEIDSKKCTACGVCKKLCRFDAISYKDGGGLEINPNRCEGCLLCLRQCPVQAISYKAKDNNFWYVSDTRMGTMVHAKMGAGEENSGRLVSRIRKRAKEIANEQNADFIINDGPPGIGCPVIASLSGTNKTLLVIEPTKSGLHDAQRLIELINKFNIPAYALINKYDINEEVTNDVEQYLADNNIELLAKLPFDKQMVRAMVNRKTITEYDSENVISQELKKVWNKISSPSF
jgi:MinD superfamily P-loop ATPase